MSKYGVFVIICPQSKHVDEIVVNSHSGPDMLQNPAPDQHLELPLLDFLSINSVDSPYGGQFVNMEKL